MRPFPGLVVMYGHPLSGLTSSAAIRARLVAGLVGAALGIAAAAVLFLAGAAA